MKPIRSAKALQRALENSGTTFVRFVNRLDREGVPYLSHSKVACIERCPRCYYRQYILGKNESSEAMRRGTIFHKAAKLFYASYKKGSPLKPSELAKQVRAKELDEETQNLLVNAAISLRANHWEGHEIVSIEEPFFMDLANGLPPVIGVPDLVLRRDDAFVVVDHKTSKSFNEIDPIQLILYGEHLRRKHGTHAIVGAIDEYRLVSDLTTIKKPAFRRTPVSVDCSFLKPLLSRYRKAWKQILTIDREGEPDSSPECWICMSALR